MIWIDYLILVPEDRRLLFNKLPVVGHKYICVGDGIASVTRGNIKYGMDVTITHAYHFINCYHITYEGIDDILGFDYVWYHDFTRGDIWDNFVRADTLTEKEKFIFTLTGRLPKRLTFKERITQHGKKIMSFIGRPIRRLH